MTAREALEAHLAYREKHGYGPPRTLPDGIEPVDGDVIELRTMGWELLGRALFRVDVVDDREAMFAVEVIPVERAGHAYWFVYRSGDLSAAFPIDQVNFTLRNAGTGKKSRDVSAQQHVAFTRVGFGIA